MPAPSNVEDANAIVEEAADVLAEYGGIEEMADAILGPAVIDGTGSIATNCGVIIACEVAKAQNAVTQTPQEIFDASLRDILSVGSSAFLYGLALGAAVQRRRDARFAEAMGR